MDIRRKRAVYAFCGFIDSTVVSKDNSMVSTHKNYRQASSRHGAPKLGINKFLFPVHSTPTCKLLITKPCPQQYSLKKNGVIIKCFGCEQRVSSSMCPAHRNLIHTFEQLPHAPSQKIQRGRCLCREFEHVRKNENSQNGLIQIASCYAGSHEPECRHVHGYRHPRNCRRFRFQSRVPPSFVH